MIWLAAGSAALGIPCGMAVRLIPFGAVLVAAALVLIGVDLAQGKDGIFLDALVTVVALQVGYVAGLVLRAALYGSRIPDSNAIDRRRGFLRHLAGHRR
jgi:hypothetical protein